MKLNFHTSKSFIAPMFGIASMLFLNALTARAAEFTDPAGDFLASYRGPRTSDLDVVTANVIFTGQSFTFTSTQAGAIGQTPAVSMSGESTAAQALLAFLRLRPVLCSMQFS